MVDTKRPTISKKSSPDTKKIVLVVAALALVVLGAYLLNQRGYFGNGVQMQKSMDNVGNIENWPEFVLGVGETVTVKGITIEVVSIGAKSTSIKVEGVSKIIGEGETFDFGKIKVGVKELEYTDNMYTRKAHLYILA